MAGDKLQLSALSKAANGMGTSADTIKTILTSCNNLVKDSINSGAGIWDGQSAAAFVTKFDELSNQITPICTEAITIGNNIKTAIEKIGAVDGSVSSASN